MFKREFSIDRDAAQSFFLFGPRGTGKTTWLREKFPDAVYLDLLDSELYRTLSARPERLRTFIPPDTDKWIILDEVQKVPEILSEVHRLIETKAHRFILTGSSARSLRRKGVDLLAGRAFTHFFHPLTRRELEGKFSLEYSLRFGHLPMAYTSADPEKFLQSYIQTYLQEEVQQEGLTRNIGGFSRFLEIASFSQGETLNISHIAREAQLDRKVVENYFSIVEDLLIGVRIGVFGKRAKRRLVSHNKFYFFDTGVFRSLRPRGPLDGESEVDGAALETLFLQEVRALNDYRGLGYSIYYWRSVSGLGVDFVLYGPKGLVAIEIKRKAHIHGKDIRGLRAFLSDYPESRAFVFCGVDREEYYGDIRVLPIETALEKLGEIL